MKAKKINWNRLARNLPTKVKVGNKIHYEVLAIKDFHGEKMYGETRFEPRQIVIREKMGPKITVETFFHEFLHALSEEHHLNLTEEQVLNFEHTLPYIFELMRKLERPNE